MEGGSTQYKEANVSEWRGAPRIKKYKNVPEEGGDSTGGGAVLQ